MDDKINRHVQSSKVNHEILHKEVISELSTVMQKTLAFRQDVSTKYQELQKWISSTTKLS